MVSFENYSLEKVVISKGNAPPKKLDMCVKIRAVEHSRGRLLIEFVFTLSYSPKAGEISLYGNTVAKGGVKEISECFSLWKKNNELPEEFLKSLLTYLNLESLPKCVIYAETVGLIPPILPPKV